MKKIKKLWKTEYENFILPYYQDSGQENNEAINYKNYIDIFTNKKVELVEYSNLDWYDSLKYPKGKGWLDGSNSYTRSLRNTDMRFLKAMLDPRCHRRVKQTIELCCELYNKLPTMYPVLTGKDALHPGNTLIHSLKILNRGCILIRISEPDFVDEAKVIKIINCLSDIQEIYKDKKIYAFFVNSLKNRNLQILVRHGNFSTFDSNGNLQWKSDVEPWPFSLFLNKLDSNTKHINNCSIIKFKYNKQRFEIKIPNDKSLQKTIFLETIKWGNENIKF